jgi:DNA-binding MarR family transcriptional regulator
MKLSKYIDASPYFKLLEAYEKLNRVIQGRLDEHGLSILQSLIVIGIYIEKESLLTPKDFYGLVRSSRGNISQAITKLEKMGLLQRKLDQRDARSYNLKITEKGKRIAPNLIKIFDVIQRNFEKRFNQNQVNEFFILVDSFSGAKI